MNLEEGKTPLENRLNEEEEESYNFRETDIKFDSPTDEYATRTEWSVEMQNLERVMGDYLVLIRRITSNKIVRDSLSAEKWTDTLILIISSRSAKWNSLPLIQGLRPRLLAVQLLVSILPGINVLTSPVSFRENVIKTILNELSLCVWSIPQTVANERAHMKLKELNRKLNRLNSLDHWNKLEITPCEDNMPVFDVAFDSDKCLYSSVENSQTVTHESGERGYALANTAITSGCYQWKFLIVKENKGNEGTCIGVARWPIKDYSHRTTSDMWLYRAYSGNLYHNGELSLCLANFTQGDYITVILDMESRTISFAKNGDDPVIAFEEVEGSPLYPCVVFYSTNPGEKVKITDMQIRGTPRNLLAGEPFCASEPVVLAESYIHLIRKLHATNSWTNEVNACLLERLNRCKCILPTFKMKWRENGDGDENYEEEKNGEKGETLMGNSWVDENQLTQLCKDVSNFDIFA